MLHLYNTLTRSKELFTPLEDKRVGLYACGPTVYNYIHIGNFRAYIFEDILRRVLERNGYTVKHVMNITDVGHLTSDADEGEDKMEVGARREGKTAWEIAAFYTGQFIEDLKALSIKMPDVMPKATDHIAEQISLIETLEGKGYTYRTLDGIYFDTSHLNDYGKLARLNVAGQEAGARIEMGEKKHPTDFALWKFSPPADGAGSHRQMEWESPWGTGFPGWHIECSAMSVKYLGQPFDIHAGGIDHIPVHHTNEIAQSEAAYGKALARFWLHNDHMVIDGEKMSKSLGNVYTVSDLVQKGFAPLDFRFFVLMAHYRAKLNFTWEALAAAQASRQTLMQQIRGLELWQQLPHVSESDPQKDEALHKHIDAFKQSFAEALNDDLNTPQAIALLQTTAADFLNLQEHGQITKTGSRLLADLFRSVDEALGMNFVWDKAIPAEIIEAVGARETAREAKDWTAADAKRPEIESAGFLVEDTPAGPRLTING
ncbi:cysteine--tRNA ligase [Candidatus Parcubacteria bacterium]|nr:cysteine--tRNA ligase [Candidatus Parcubacteria bacterium]